MISINSVPKQLDMTKLIYRLITQRYEKDN